MKVRTSALPTERAEQMAVCDWWASYCKTRGLHENLLLSIPNGSVLAGDSKRRAIQMNNLKRTGLRIGAPDLMLAVPRRHLHPTNLGIGINVAGYLTVDLFSGLFIEMKRRGEKGRPEQIAFADLLRRQGYSCVIACGADEAIRAVRGYLGT